MCEINNHQDGLPSSLCSIIPIPPQIVGNEKSPHSNCALDDKGKSCGYRSDEDTALSPLPDAHLSDTAIVHRRHTPECLYPLRDAPEVPITATIRSTGKEHHTLTHVLVDLEQEKDVFPSMERQSVRLLSGYFMYFLCGWGDGVTGTVIPYFEAEFGLTTLTSSLLFTGSTVGRVYFFTATFLLEKVVRSLGQFDPSNEMRSLAPIILPFCRRLFKNRSRSKVIGHSASQGRYLTLLYFSVIHALFFVLMSLRGGYPILLLSYAVAAFSRGMLTAQLNLYFSQGPSHAISISFALWSLGGVISPLVCQSIIATGTPWPRFYLGSLVLSALNTIFILCAFRPTSNEFAKDRHRTSNVTTQFGSRQARLDATHGLPVESSNASLRQAFRMPYQWAVSIFSWLYCGSETTTQGFMVSYLLTIRGANPKTAGYVTSGFWGGITVGRLLWGRYASRLSFAGRKLAVHFCLGLALTMHLLIWFVHSNVENAFSSGMIGLAYGPIFPACLGLANDLLPDHVHMVSMGLISAFASLGSSFFPFITGTISSVKGMQSLTYVTVAESFALIFLWYLLPSRLIIPQTSQ